MHPHIHHVVTPGFVDIPRGGDGTAGQMDGEAELVDRKWEDRVNNNKNPRQ